VNQNERIYIPPRLPRKHQSDEVIMLAFAMLAVVVAGVIAVVIWLFHR
jgi:hypothetical protein